ncbi:MAG: hypothetical protein ACI9EF_001762 [Pseudohongiellaceae bacterium]|jgi:hypothetical protein
MPIKIKLKGSVAAGEPWTGYIGVATGLTTRITPAGHVELSPSTDVAEKDLSATDDGNMHVDVHLVWRSEGVISATLPSDSTESKDLPSATTRLLFSKVTLGSEGAPPYRFHWESGDIQLNVKPGACHEFITAYFTLPGQDISNAVASDTAMIESPYANNPGWQNFIYRILG